MKNNLKIIFAISLFICTICLMVACGNSFNNEQETSADSIMYNSYYTYTQENIDFILKERGYDFVEEYNSDSIRFLKKELLIMLKDKTLNDQELFCEIYNGEELSLRSILYKDGDYFYSEMRLSNIAKFDNIINVKILNGNNELIYEFKTEAKEE